MTQPNTDQTDPKLTPNLAQEVYTFVQHLESLNTSLPHVMSAVTAILADADDKFLNYANKYGEISRETEEFKLYAFKPPYHLAAARLKRELDRAVVADDLIPRIFVLALAGQYDAFIGRLLRTLFMLRPELLQNSERTLTLSQLLELGNIENATDYLIEKEIETVLRKSHADQFSWMENKFSMKLREGLDSWPVFVELMERRNLFAHANGVVSDQYINVCRNHGVELPSACDRGAELNITPEYLHCAYACIFEIAVKLSQVLWRKLRPDQLSEADSNLIAVAYDLLVTRKYDLACKLLDFACVTLKKYSSEEMRRMMIVNRAQAYKWAGKQDQCVQILSKEDWSASDQKFQMAVAILSDDFENGYKLMKSIGAHSSLDETAYQEWPLFREFRKSDAFMTIFQEVFGEPFVHIEKVLRADEKERLRERLKKMTQDISLE